MTRRRTTSSEHVIVARLRSATEDDVESVVAVAGTDGNIELVNAEDLLAFFNRMLDLLPKDHIQKPS
jgi:hypothetical protein